MSFCAVDVPPRSANEPSPVLPLPRRPLRALAEAHHRANFCAKVSRSLLREVLESGGFCKGGWLLPKPVVEKCG
jgi:hypothetical protein